MQKATNAQSPACALSVINHVLAVPSSACGALALRAGGFSCGPKKKRGNLLLWKPPSRSLCYFIECPAEEKGTLLLAPQIHGDVIRSSPRIRTNPLRLLLQIPVQRIPQIPRWSDFLRKTKKKQTPFRPKNSPTSIPVSPLSTAELLTYNSSETGPSPQLSFSRPKARRGLKTST